MDSKNVAQYLASNARGRTHEGPIADLPEDAQNYLLSISEKLSTYQKKYNSGKRIDKIDLNGSVHDAERNSFIKDLYDSVRQAVQKGYQKYALIKQAAGFLNISA